MRRVFGPPGFRTAKTVHFFSETPPFLAVLQIECEPCPYAHVGINGTCSLCPDGKEPDRLQITCQTCPYGFTGVRGECFRCDPGTMPNEDRTFCTPCETNRVGLG